MATTITRVLYNLALFLLVAQIAEAVLTPKIKNHDELKPQSSSTYIVHTSYLAKPPRFASLEEWYHSMVTTQASSTRPANSSGILYTYDTVMHGFAVQLTGDEARLMSSAPGVIGVHKGRVLHPHTTRSPGFMGLEPSSGAWKETDFGDGVVIGFIDTGIWPESASFDDTGLGPVRSSWRGKCVDADDFKASLCNNKLVGAKAFHAAANAMAGIASSGTIPSPRDQEGHGTHVASTAAGGEARNASFNTFSRGTARGMAPKARIAMYRACYVKGCSDADIVAAVDAAVKDGVDIISMSIGDSRLKPFHNDSIAISTFGAVRAGVFVVLSGGNDGPREYTVRNSAPWVTTVGASTVDRLFPANLTLGNGMVLEGQSLYTMQANGTGIRLQNPGGAGIVEVDPFEWSRDSLTPSPFTTPGITLGYSAGEKYKAYNASVPCPVTSFSFGCETVIGKNEAPVVAGFSSRGPNPVVPNLLKPDVVAPGVAILAAWPDDAVDAPTSRNPNDGRTAGYNILSGTSMACPHVAGVAALIKKKHPSWTPAMVRSALMTTARTVDNRGGGILDNGVTRGRTDNVRVATPLVAGAGHVLPNPALDPGLVYDAGERDYVDFLCALNYTAAQMRLFVPDFVNCTTTLAGGPAGLNYPSFVVAFDRGAAVRTLTRTLTKVSEEAETYTVSVEAPEQVKVTVTPTTLEFKEHMEKRSYSVEFRNEAGGSRNAEWDFGQIIWANEKHQVRSPVAFRWDN